ncbi:MAG: hypothetical protein ACRD35_02535 [Candidatus Acidiferrales bacterium]
MSALRFLFGRGPKTAAALLCLLLSPLAVLAEDQPADDLLARLKALEERVQQLEAELAALKNAPTPSGAAAGAPPPAVAAAPAPPGAPGTPSGTLPVYGGGSTALSKVFNPDIGVIGNFIGAAGSNSVNPFPSLSMAESEVSFQAVVDPYARADFFIAFGEEGVELEEGYLTFPALPGALLAKVGKMRSPFGKVNTLHSHNLPWIDRPLMTDNLVAGEEGLTDAGLSISRLLPAPGGLFLEATAQIYRGDSGDLFQANDRKDVAAVGHLKSYYDLTDQTNIEIGGSYARGHNDRGSDFVTRLFGLDATLRWKPLRRAIYRSFIARTEMTWSRRDEVFGPARAFGYFASLDYQFGRRWFLGGRYDWTERARNAAEHDSGGSILLTYWPSEFSQIRGQLRRTRYAEGMTANELLFQFLFIIGAHGAHPF